MMSSILIVEDDITFGMMLKTWLGKKGFEVSSVSNIARAESILKVRLLTWYYQIYGCPITKVSIC